MDLILHSNSRHKQVASCVRDTATSGWSGVPVKSQNTTQQTQKIEGEDKHNHTAQGNTTDPPGNENIMNNVKGTWKTLQRNLLSCGVESSEVPVEIHLIDLREDVLDLRVCVRHHFAEVGQGAVNWEELGESGDVWSNVVQKNLHPYRKATTVLENASVQDLVTIFS